MEQNWSENELKFRAAIKEIIETDPDFWSEKPTVDADLSFIPISQKKTRRKRIFLGATAAVLAIFVISSVLAVWMNSTAAYAIKFKLERQYYKLTGLIISDTAEVSDENIMVFKAENESEIEGMKKVWNDLLIPSYIPDSYQFEYLEIQKDIFGIIKAHYRYSSEYEDVLFIGEINSISSETPMSWNNDTPVKIGDKSVSFWSDPVAGVNGASFNFSRNSIEILCTLENDEIIKIIDSLE